MDPDVVSDSTVPGDDVNSIEPEAGSNKLDLLEDLSFNGDATGELGSADEVLKRVELDFACSSEKLVNLSILMMHVATKESDFEAFASEKENISVDSLEKALEFDFLSGILDSEVREMEIFMATLQAEIVNVREAVSTCEHLGQTFLEIEEKLHDSEKSLAQSQDQVSEMRMQSAKFQRIFSHFGREENWNSDKGADFLENGENMNTTTKINMQTAEQQRHILRLLEKSLARELDLEKKLTESRQIEEELKLRLRSSEQEVICMEEETRDVLERFFEADNAAGVLMGVSKELLGRLQMFQFNMNGLVQREDELRSKLEDSTKMLQSKDSALQKLGSSSRELHDFLVAQSDALKAKLTEADRNLILANSEALTMRERVSALENQLKDYEFQLLNAKNSVDGNQDQHTDLYSKIHEMEILVRDLKEKISKAESRAESAEVKCKMLQEVNTELTDELALLKHSRGATEKVDLLEQQLRESDMQLQHARASAEASEEKQRMLSSEIGDMDNLIKDLKSKVLKAESRADSAEDKCIILSESNAELNEELSFLRGRMACLEASLHQAEETKVATAKDIGIRTKVITNMVVQLAFERERLHKQISSLAKENKFLVVKLLQPNKNVSVVTSHGKGNDKKFLFPEHSKGEVTEFSATSFELDKTSKNIEKDANSTSDLECVRRIDAGLLNWKHLALAILTILIATAVYSYQQGNYVNFV